jgi:hypothetical protein
MMVFTNMEWRNNPDSVAPFTIVSDKGNIARTIVDSNISDEERKANAKLIALSPQLYEVLSYVENMMAYKSDHNELAHDDLRLFRQVKDTLNKIRD